MNLDPLINGKYESKQIRVQHIDTHKKKKKKSTLKKKFFY